MKTYRLNIGSGETAVTAATWDTSCGVVPQDFTHTDDSGFTEIVTDGHWTFDNNMIKFTASTNPTNAVREGYMTITYKVNGVSCEKRTHLVQAAGQGFNGKVKYTLNNSMEIITPCDTGSTVGRTIYSGSVVTADIGNCVTSIGAWAFYGCTNLTGVTIPNNITNIGENAFSGCTSLPSITIPSGVTTIGDRAFHSCRSFTSIDIPNSVRGIGDFTFYWCYNLTSCTIGNSVTSIGYEAFNDCYSLTSINLPNSLTNIDYGAFYQCDSLTGITIPDSVTSIGERAFFNCSGLTSVTIGSGITSIGQYAFEGCTSFQSVTIKATTPPSIDWGTFPNSESYLIYVPSSSVSSYQDAYSAYSWVVSKIQPIP